jgi:hypothetical protein
VWVACEARAVRAACADALSQVTAAVDFVAGDEPGADSLVVRVLQQVARELRFRLERDLVGNSGQFAALLVGGPAFRQVQGPADQGALMSELVRSVAPPVGDGAGAPDAVPRIGTALI